MRSSASIFGVMVLHYFVMTLVIAVLTLVFMLVLLLIGDNEWVLLVIPCDGLTLACEWYSQGYDCTHSCCHV